MPDMHVQRSHFCPIFDLSNLSQVSRDISEKKVGGGPWKVTIHGGVLKWTSSFFPKAALDG